MFFQTVIFTEFRERKRRKGGRAEYLPGNFVVCENREEGKIDK